ncbi:MAG: hypothetical protein ABIH92_03410 [Nanoarchaeota archaeon]
MVNGYRQQTRTYEVPVDQVGRLNRFFDESNLGSPDFRADMDRHPDYKTFRAPRGFQAALSRLDETTMREFRRLATPLS